MSGRAAATGVRTADQPQLFAWTASMIPRKVSRRPQDVSGSFASVSVIIPCFNYARYLPAAVASALGQHGVDVDVIIVDDASTDDSLAVARALAVADSRITVVSHGENRGAVDTFNDGIPLVTGEFMVRLDADDLLTPGSLQRATLAARAFPGVGLVYGHPVHFVGEPPRHTRSRARRWVVWPGEQWLTGRCHDALNVITSPEVVMRTAVVREVGGQRQIKHAHDMEMWLRIASVSDVLYIRGADQALHRDHDGSLSTKMTDPLADMSERRQAFEVLFDGTAGSLPRADTMHRLARRALADQAMTSAAHEFDRRRSDPDLTKRFVDFARQTDALAPRSRRWAALQRRISLGQRGVNRRPWYAGSARARRICSIVRGSLWDRFGTYDGR